MGSQPLMAGEPVDYTKILTGTSIMELPAKAASLVAKAGVQQEQKSVTIAVVKAAVQLNPTAAAAVVGAISRAEPEMAPVAAVTAAVLQHKQLGLITKAAAGAVPAQAAKIVAALIKEFPSSYAVIAIAASEGAPKAGKEVLAVVADYVPAVQAGINSAVASFSSSQALPVQAILNQAVSQSGVAVPAEVLPLGPPPTPIPPPVATISPSQTIPQAPGARSNASP